MATTHQARTRVEPEQHRSIGSHEQVRDADVLCLEVHVLAECAIASVATSHSLTCIDLPLPSVACSRVVLCCLQTQQPPEPLDWAHQWYPIGGAEDMDPSRPHAITLLGRDLVLWRDQQGDWRAFEDICPHRLAPLSGAARGHLRSSLSVLFIRCHHAQDLSAMHCPSLPVCRQQQGGAVDAWISQDTCRV